jgi:hypothetical protein
LQYLLADFGLCVVTDEFGGCTAAADVLLECAEKFTVGFAAVDITDLCLGADVELSTGGAVVDSGRVGVHIVGGEGFIASGDVEGRELSFVVAMEDFALWHAGILRSFGKSTFHSVRTEVAEVGAKAFIVGFTVNDSVLV